jgi:hypothetical protein
MPAQHQAEAAPGSGATVGLAEAVRRYERAELAADFARLNALERDLAEQIRIHAEFKHRINQQLATVRAIVYTKRAPGTLATSEGENTRQRSG